MTVPTATGSDRTAMADLLTLVAAGGRLGERSLEAAAEAAGLAVGPLRHPPMLLAIAQVGSWEVVEHTARLSFLSGGDSLAGAAAALAGDAAELEAAALRFGAAQVYEYLTEPIDVVAPHGFWDSQADWDVVSQTTVALQGQAWLRFVKGEVGGTMKTERFRNGHVRVTLAGAVLGGATVQAKAPADRGFDVSVLAGATTEATWIVRDEAEARRLVVRLAADVLNVADANGTAAPPPDTWTVGGLVAADANLELADDLRGHARAQLGFKVTNGRDGKTAYDLALEGEASLDLAPGLAGAVGRTPTAGSPGLHTGLGQPGAPAELGVTISRDAEGKLETLTVRLKAGASTFAGEGSGAQAGTLRKLVIGRSDLVELGDEGSGALAALDDDFDSPTRAVDALAALDRVVTRHGAELLREGDLHVDDIATTGTVVPAGSAGAPGAAGVEGSVTLAHEQYRRRTRPEGWDDLAMGQFDDRLAGTTGSGGGRVASPM